MISSRLDTRLNCYAPRTTGTDFGHGNLEWDPSPVGCWAERVAFKGESRETAGEITAVYFADFNVRWETPPGENWRLADTSEPEKLWQVVAVIGNRRKGMKTLKCRLVNP